MAALVVLLDWGPWRHTSWITPAAGILAMACAGACVYVSVQIHKLSSALDDMLDGNPFAGLARLLRPRTGIGIYLVLAASLVRLTLTAQTVLSMRKAQPGRRRVIVGTAALWFARSRPEWASGSRTTSTWSR